MHLNSIKAYYEEKPKLGKRAKHIHNFLCTNEGLFTDREIQQRLGYAEPNNVRPRITELVKAGVIEECGRVKCPVTGKLVRRVTANFNIPE